MGSIKSARACLANSPHAATELLTNKIADESGSRARCCRLWSATHLLHATTCWDAQGHVLKRHAQLLRLWPPAQARKVQRFARTHGRLHAAVHMQAASCAFRATSPPHPTPLHPNPARDPPFSRPPAADLQVPQRQAPQHVLLRVVMPHLQPSCGVRTPGCARLRLGAGSKPGAGPRLRMRSAPNWDQYAMSAVEWHPQRLLPYLQPSQRVLVHTAIGPEGPHRLAQPCRSRGGCRGGRRGSCRCCAAASGGRRSGRGRRLWGQVVRAPRCIVHPPVPAGVCMVGGNIWLAPGSLD